MRVLIVIILWFILFSISWPVAVVLFFLLPLIWLLLLPFRIVGFTLELVFRIIEGIVLFPFQVIKSL
ncbi:MAG: hypothetical protein ABJ004_06885 [Cyclobacteriaceae bacterium]